MLRLWQKRVTYLVGLFTFLLFSSMSHAALKAMNNNELSTVVGQALINVSNHGYGSPIGEGNFSATRLTMTSRVEIAAKVGQAWLFGFERTHGSDGFGCSGAWNGTAACARPKPTKYTYQCYLNDCYNGYGDSPGLVGWSHKPFGYDIRMNNITLGKIDNNGNVIEPFVVINPYFEIIRANNTGDFAGFRMGAERMTGHIQLQNGNIGDGIWDLTGQTVASLWNQNINVFNYDAYSIRSPLRMKFLNQVPIPMPVQAALASNGYQSFDSIDLDVANAYISFQTHTIDYFTNGAPAAPGGWMYLNQTEQIDGSDGMVNINLFN